MDFLRDQFVIVQERLRGLTPSQKLLAAALVVITVMTMLYWGRFASNSETVNLFPTPVSATELPAVISALSNSGISYTNQGGIISVPMDRQLDAINAVTTAGAMASSNGGTSPLDAMLDKFSPLGTQTEFNVRLQSARNNNLMRSIRSWPGVKTVNVQVTESQRGNTLSPIPAGAFVDITTTGNVNPKKIANYALAAVLPTVPSLVASNVTVTVNGVAVIKAGGNNDGFGFAANDLMENKTEYESFTEQKIKETYRIDGLRVQVVAEVDGESKHIKASTPDAKNKVSLPIESTSEKTQTTDPAPIGEAGAVPNIGMDVNAGAVAKSGSKTERSEERFENKVGITETETRSGPGQTKIVGVSVGVPRGHFVKLYKQGNKGAEPDDTQLAGLMQRELDKMKAEILVATALKDTAAVVVNDYVDFADTNDLMLAGNAAAAAPGTVSLLASSHGKEVAIGALALTSLFMVGRMVKKSSPPPTPPLLALDDMPDVSSGKKGRKPGTLGGVDIAGEVAEGGAIMMGQELDEEVLETSQMVEQVSGFVKDNPDTTAQLLKRWMNRE